MKPASEVARELSNRLMTDARLRQNDPVETIAQALTAFAEERVKEALEKSHFYCTPGDAWKQARAEALEEAANLLESCRYAPDDLNTESSIWSDKMTRLAHRIRALKEKP